MPNSMQMVGGGAMSRTSAMPGPNMIDSGSFSKPGFNNQPENSARLMGQNIGQNTMTAGQQANVAAVRTVQNGQTSASDQEVKAQQFARQRIAEALYANDAGSALMKMNAVAQSPEKSAMMNDLAVAKAMSVGTNPDLGAVAAQGQMYA